MIRSLILIVLLRAFAEILLSALILATWVRISTKKELKPVFGFLAMAFINMGFWNFFKGNYLLSIVAILFFMISLVVFMFQPLVETWDICKS